jgi:hypothetical protein
MPPRLGADVGGDWNEKRTENVNAPPNTALQLEPPLWGRYDPCANPREVFMPQALAPFSPELAADVQAYAEANGLVNYLRQAIQLADELLRPIASLSVCVEEDPEVEADSFLVIDVTTKLTPAEARPRRAEFTDRWVAAVPPSVIGRISLVTAFE